MDRIRLEGIQLGIRVGITAEERETPQPCRLDLVLKADLGQAGQSGDLKKTVDYVSILSCVEEICTQQSFTLLEEIAHQTCETLLRQFAVQEVKLQIRKTRPFSDKLSSVGVQFKRKRRDFRK
jgi:7,8-dihydroneopterin aldolase/epimerase/oxygenase